MECKQRLIIFLGDFPSFKWEELKAHIPENLEGEKVLDSGCNAGFYSFKLAKRGAQVTGIDLDPHYLNTSPMGRTMVRDKQPV